MPPRRLPAWPLIVALVAMFGTGLAQAERPPMAPRQPKVEAKAPEYSIETDAEGNWVIRYVNDEGPVVVVYEPPNKIEARVSATVQRDFTGGFVYRYRLESSPKSKQTLDAFILEFTGQASALEAPKRWEAFELEWMKAIVWKPYILGQDPALGPGEGMGGFKLTVPLGPAGGKLVNETSGGPSGGGVLYEGTIPGIVDCHATGSNGILTYPDEPPDSIQENMPRWPFDGVSGRTIGPVEVPAGSPVSWVVDRLRANLEESRRLNWIANTAVLNKYLEVLAQFASYIRRAGPIELENLRFIAEQAQQDLGQGNITSEAYALLKYTSQLLELFLVQAQTAS